MFQSPCHPLILKLMSAAISKTQWHGGALSSISFTCQWLCYIDDNLTMLCGILYLRNHILLFPNIIILSIAEVID